MKKIVASLLVLAFLCSIALASSQGGEDAGPKGIHEAGTGIENPEMKEEAQGTGQGLEDEKEVIVVEEEVVAEPEAKMDKEAAPEPIAIAAEEEKEEAKTEPEKQPGFEALFAVAGLLAAALVLRLRS
ncbi:MAG TPA: PGF-CTERM sorting domain-containing protein [Methanotrichaceae archaeon]|nr:PGF-CTERM sorting domain-containing protein [Methanotrichaceae archaeon]